MDSDAEGVPSEFFDYFKVLCIQGFLTCHKHVEWIILLVEMLQDSDFPCFKGGSRTIQNLRKRFHLSLTVRAMCDFGAFTDQQQLGCLVDSTVCLLSESRIVSTGYIFNFWHLVTDLEVNNEKYAWGYVAMEH